MANIAIKKNKTVNVSSEIKVDGVVVRSQQYTINSENPVSYTSSSNAGYGGEASQLYKDNRAEVRAMESEFEDEVFALIDEMIAEKEGGNK